MDIQYHILGVLAHAKSRASKSRYPLPPIEKWTKEFCDTLNSIQFGEEIQFHLQDNLPKASVEKSDFNSLHIKVNEIYIYRDLKTDFVHFSNTVILKNTNDEIKSNCLRSISAHLAVIFKLKPIREEILKKCDGFDNAEQAQKYCNNIQQLFCAECYTTNNNTVTEDGKTEKYSNDAFYELLQNANDHICDGNLYISLKGNAVTLSYNEETGFSARDFFAICTIGNSGNMAYKGSTGRPGATGHKGSGFKSVYNHFKKVVIRSGYVQCTFDTEKKIDYQLNKDLEYNIPEYEKAASISGRRTYQPFPFFEYLKPENHPRTTSIELTFREGVKEFHEYLKQYGLCDDDFQCKPAYYFLNKINKIFTNFNSNHMEGYKEFDRNKFIEDNFYAYSYGGRTNAFGLSENNMPHSKKDMKEFAVDFLFPKEIPGDDPKIFCTLPVNSFDGEWSCKIKFYVNCPVWELNDSRNNYAQTFLKWNGQIYIHMFVENPGWFQTVFTQFAEEHKDIAYKYFPYADEYVSHWRYLKQLPFLRTVTQLPEQNPPQLKSMEELGDTAFILPNCMYEWLKSKHYSHKSFQLNSSEPFLFYPGNGIPTFLLEPGHDVHKTWKGCLASAKADISQFTAYLDALFYTERNEPLSNQEPLGVFLKSLWDECNHNRENNSAFYSWYLGKTICESQKVHNFPTENAIDGYESVGPYSARISEFFALNAQGKIWGDEKQLLQCFIDKLDIEKKIAEFGTKEFYQKHTPAEWNKYWKYVIQCAEYVVQYKNAIVSFLNDTLELATHTEEKYRDLLLKLLSMDIDANLYWNDNYRPLPKEYINILKSKLYDIRVKFIFLDNPLAEIPAPIMEKINDRVSENERKCVDFHKVKYSARYDGGYCIGYAAEAYAGREVFVVFGEQGLAELLRDRWGVQAYLSPRQCTAMSSYAPLPLFRAYDTELDQLEPCAVKKLPENNAYDEWKSLLLKRFEWRKDTKWHCAAGYGDPEQYKSACPVCGGKLVAEATSLRIKNVRLCQQTHIPVLLCRNCADAFHYSYDVYFCKGNDDPEKLDAEEARNQIEQTDEMYICFRLSGHESKIFPVKLTLLHRRIALVKLGGA